ncbi:MAG: hypothetical protein ABS939_21775, partial [Psychrobacillus sp.]
TREFGEGGGTDLIADMLGYGVPGLGAVKAIRGTSLGAKGLTTGISARNLGQFAKEGAAVGSIMSAGEIGSRELLNPEDTNWKQNASELGLNIAAGATLDPLFSMAVPIAKSVQKMVNEKAIVEAVNSPSKIGERIPKGTVKIEGMPPLVQSRVNLRNGSAAEGAGFNHVLDRHFNPSKNASQFSITPDVLKGVLQSKEVVNTPVSKVLYSDIKLADGTIEKQARYVREVTLDSNIGIDKFSGSPTNIMTVLTDKYGNLVTTTPGVIK